MNESLPANPAVGVYVKAGAVPLSAPCTGCVSTSKLNAALSGSTPDNVTGTATSCVVETDTGSAVGGRFCAPSAKSTVVVVFALTVAGFVAPLNPVPRAGCTVMLHVAGPPLSASGALLIVYAPAASVVAEPPKLDPTNRPASGLPSGPVT